MGASEVLCIKGKRDPPGGHARFPRRADVEQMWRDWRGLNAVFVNVVALVSNNYYPL